MLFSAMPTAEALMFADKRHLTQLAYIWAAVQASLSQVAAGRISFWF